MTDELKKAVRPIYTELQGYLSQAPGSKTPHDTIVDASIWNQINGVVDLLSEKTGIDYSRFKIEPTQDRISPFIRLIAYRQKVSGLISRLHGEYFSDEQTPFGSMPSTVITQNQQQNVSVQMLLDFQSTIDRALLTAEPGSKEKGFLDKLKSSLGSVSNVNDLIRKSMKLARDCGLTVQDILSIWGG